MLDHTFVVTFNNKYRCEMSNLRMALKVFNAYMDIREDMHPSAIIELIDSESSEILLSSEYDR